jgi:hypothetical protein
MKRSTFYRSEEWIGSSLIRGETEDYFYFFCASRLLVQRHGTVMPKKWEDPVSAQLFFSHL